MHFLRESSIKLGMHAESKNQMLQQMIDLLCVSNSLLEHRSIIEECILYREHQRSTVMKRGVALPHGKSEVIPRICTAFGIYPAGLELDSIDGHKTHFVFCIVSDYENGYKLVQYMSQSMHILQNTDISKEILKATDPKVVLSIIRRERSILEDRQQKYSETMR